MANLKETQNSLKPCKCGGRACIGKIIKLSKNSFTHLVLQCRDCGAWMGGITSKEGVTNANN